MKVDVGEAIHPGTDLMMNLLHSLVGETGTTCLQSQRSSGPQVIGPQWHCGAYGHIQAHCLISHGRLYHLPVVSTSSEMGKELFESVGSSVCGEILHDKCVDSDVCNPKATRMGARKFTKVMMGRQRSWW